MRVLQISNFYPPYWVGGYEQIAEWVARGLRERGHRVDVLTGKGRAFAGREEIHGKLDLDLDEELGSYFATGVAARAGRLRRLGLHVFSPRNFVAALRAIGLLRPDIVSFWNPAYISFSPLVASRVAGIPAVAHLSDTVVNALRSPHALRRGRRLGQAAVDFVLRLARPRRVVVPSVFLRDKFVTQEGLPLDRTAVLHWPVEPTISRRDSIPTRTCFRRLLFLGTLIPQKGPDVLMQAFRLALARRPELTLTLVGEGAADYVARLREEARGLPVRFTGRQDRAGVIRAYEEHDILVFPSVWDEPYAVVPPEAMAMGLAVVASTAGGTPEAVVDGETGLLVPPGDAAALSQALLRLAGDPALGRRLAAAGQAWMRKNHSFDVFVEKLERLYGGVLEEARTR